MLNKYKIVEDCPEHDIEINILDKDIIERGRKNIYIGDKDEMYVYIQEIFKDNEDNWNFPKKGIFVVVDVLSHDDYFSSKHHMIWQREIPIKLSIEGLYSYIVETFLIS